MIGSEREVLLAPGAEFCVLARTCVKDPLGRRRTQLTVMVAPPVQ
jgi:hypothetical protein